MKRLLSLLLSAALFLSSGCAPLRGVAASYAGVPAAGRRTDRSDGFHTELSFPELPDEAPPAQAEIARARELIFRLERGELSGGKARKALDAREQAYRDLCTAAAIAYVRYCFDVTDAARRDAYETLTVQTEELNGLLIDAELLLAADPALSDLYDEATREALRRADTLHDPKLTPLVERERELIGRFDALSAGFTVSDGERLWTKEEILSDDTLSYDAFLRLYNAYETAYNEAAGGIYLELIDVRNRIADACGYRSYAEYAYADFGRDYSTADTARLAAQIEERFVPLFTGLQSAYYGAMMRLSCGTFERDATMARIRTAAVNLLPELETPWTYMCTHGMYDLDASAGRMQGSYTTYFASYGAPFLFSSWDDSYGMPSTILHEFGHYAGYYLNGDRKTSDPLDLAEVDSQGLEMLAFSQYDLLYGPLKDAAETANLFYALYVLIDSCVEDAFQQYAYHTPNVTVEMLNREYGRLCAAYGLADLGLSELAWTEVPHTFRSPMYYISYGTGMLAALELFTRAKTDPEGAKEIYRRILLRDGGPFRETVQGAGLSDPLAPETVDLLAEKLTAIADAAPYRENGERNSDGTTGT